jgi:hypothetical protein
VIYIVVIADNEDQAGYRIRDGEGVVFLDVTEATRFADGQRPFGDVFVMKATPTHWYPQRREEVL